MTRRDIAIIRAAIMSLRRQAAIYGKCGRVKIQEQYTRWADAIAELVKRTPKGCRGCAYEHGQNGRCVDCARVENRTDNFRRKFV